MEKKSSELFVNSPFTFESYAAHCEKDVENVAPGEPPKTTIKMNADSEHPLSFAYAPREGLYLSGNAGAVLSGNVLGKMLSLPDGDVDQLIAYFTEHGFLFPISKDSYTAVDAELAMEMVCRIKATVHLMNAIAGKKNYKNILIHTTYLLFAPQIQIELGEDTYCTHRHPFSEMLGTYMQFPDLQRNQEVFDTKKYSVADTLVGRKNPVDIEFINAVRSFGDSGIVGTKDSRFVSVMAMYLALPNLNEVLRTIIDFYFHYQTEVAVIKEVKYNRLTYYSTPDRENFTEGMKAALLRIAHSVIADEVNAGIVGVHPKYDPDTLTPSWQVDTLLQALYFSVFYMKPGVQIYKECANPNCKRDKFFLVNATRANKDYCCPKCARAAASRRYRETHPEIK